MTKDELIPVAKAGAATFDLDSALVCAIVQRESSWDVNVAPRFEPDYKEKYIDPMGLPEPEATQRATSWGLMQLMGESARESGYFGPLPNLQIPEVGLYWGCKWLKKKIDKARGDIEQALLLWNGGANHHYPDEVMTIAWEYRESKGTGEDS